MTGRPFKDKTWYPYAVAACIGVALFVLLTRFGSIWQGCKTFIGFFSPVILGCVIAYIGALLGYEDYGAAANDPLVLSLMDKNYGQTNRALCRHFGYDPQDQAEFAALSRRKFCDRTIADTIARNAREPHRKLAAGERIIGAATLLQRCGMDTSVLALTAAAAMLYTDPSDKVWSAMQAENSCAELLQTLCGLSQDDPLHQAILTYHAQLSSDPTAVINKAKGE